MLATTAHRRRIADTVGVIVVIIGMMLGLVPGITAPSASATGTDHPLGVGEFEMDGDIEGDHDWVGQGGEQTPDGLGNDDTNIFKGGVKELDYPWDASDFTEKMNAPKSDLLRLFVGSQVDPAGSFMWLAASRDSSVGNTQVNAEFNQAIMTDLVGAYRTDGDFILRFNFPGSGDVNDVDVTIKYWDASLNGGAGGYTPQAFIDPSEFRAAVGTLDTSGREFVELEINLEAILDATPPGQDPCDSVFNSVSFRSESSGGNFDNNNPTLKDVGGPFPVSLSPCGEVTVEKVDAEGNPLEDAEFTIYAGADNTNPSDAVASCTTDATGICSFGALTPGFYTVDETIVPDGYTKPVDLPETFEVLTATNLALGPYVDPRIDYVIDVNPDGNNAVGNDHVFTVHLEDADGTAMAGEEIDLVWTGVGDGITAIDGEAVGPFSTTTCTTDADGDCDVTVSSDEPGSGVLAAYWATPYQNTVTADPAVAATAGEPVDEITDSATKTWIGYRAEIEADGLNLVGQDHTFTATVYEVDGADPDELAEGVTVTFSWDAGTADGSSLDSSTCETDDTGTCSVVASDGGTPGTGTISIVQLNGVVGDEEALEVSFDAGDISATKTWREYRATIDDDSVNPAGQDHTFNVTVEYRDVNEDDAWQLADDGTTVGWDSTGDGSDDLDASSCDDGTVNGECTIVVTSDAPGSRTVTLTSVDGALLGDAGTDSETYAVSDEATKTWLDFTVDITPNGDNLAGEPHTFTVHVQQFDGVSFSDVAEGSVIVFETSDGGATLDSETCSTGTDANGECTITVLSASAGTVKVTVTGIDGYTGFDEAADVTFETAGEATKTWYEYRASVTADGVNLVRDDHEFTITAEVNDGSGWAAVLDGTDVDFTWTGDGQVAETNGSPDIDATTCTTTGGTCTVTVSSASAGSGIIEVTAVENTSATDSDVSSVDVSAGANLEEGQSTAAGKTWVAFRSTISRDSVNRTGDPHDFTITTEYTSDGSSWLPVPDGSSVSFDSTGVGSVDSDTCDSTVGGDCTVTVVSDESGQRSVTVTGVVATVTVNDIEETFEVTYESGASGVLDGFSPAEATKTWASYSLDINPPVANNLLPDDPTHVYTVTLSSDDAENAPVGGQDVAVTITGDVGLIIGVEAGSVADGGLSAVCTTADDGTCDITISSDTPGSATLSASYEATVGDSDPFTVGPVEAVKNWTTFRVTVESDAVNVVGNPHTFTVLVEQSDADGVWGPVEGAVPAISVGGSATITENLCAAGTDASGTCDVTIVSDQVETVVLTAEYEHSIDETTTTFSGDASKTWVDFDIDIRDNATNLVNTTHTFVVRVTTTVPSDGLATTSAVEGAHPTITLNPEGSAGTVGSIIDDGCAEDGTDAFGECTVTIQSAATGLSVVQASYQGTTADDEVGKTVETDVQEQGQKLWVDYRISLSPDAINAAGDAHEFIATLEVDNGDGEGFVPAAGEVVDFTVDPDEAYVSDTCADGTDDAGQCSIVVNSVTPGQADVAVSYLAVAGETSRTIGDESTKFWTDISLTKTAVDSSAPDEGDLLPLLGFTNPVTNTEFLGLSFNASTPGPLTAVYEFVITNTGPVALTNIVLTDDRIGTILDGTEGITLEPGESTTVRGSEDFTVDDAPGAGSLAPTFVTNIGTVTGTPVEDESVTVTDQDDEQIVLDYVEGTPNVRLDKRVVFAGEANDLGSDVTKSLFTDSRFDIDDPFGFIGDLKWTPAETEADTPKTMVFEYLITNTSVDQTLTNIVLTDVADHNTEILADGSIPLITLTVLDGTEGITLAPGESTTATATITVRPSTFFNDAENGVIRDSAGTGAGWSKPHLNEAVVTTTLLDGSPGPESREDARIETTAVLGVQMGAPGLGNAGLLFPISLLLTLIGAAVLFMDRRWSFDR